MKNQLSLIEKAVLKKIFSGPQPFLVSFDKQIDVCEVIKREYTGYGFYTTISIPDSFPRRRGVDIKFGDVTAEIPGLSAGAGFLVYVKDGVVELLEGYSYGEPWPSSTENFSLSYSDGEERDLSGLELVSSQGIVRGT